MNLPEIENRIIEKLQDVPKQFQGGEGNTLWTQAIKFSLGMLGREIEYGVCTSGMREHFDAEWLFDLCWYISSPEGELLEMLLAVESEWNPKFKDIKYDFEKLLIARAKIKVMIFQAKGPSVAEYFAKLEKGIRTYQGGSAGETYLLACFDEERWIFDIKKVEGA